MADPNKVEVERPLWESGTKQTRDTPSVAFAHPFLRKLNSTTTVRTIYSHRGSTDTNSEVIENGDADQTRVPRLRRTRSEDVTPRVREQWATELWNRPALPESFALLKASVEDFERVASQRRWNDLLKIQADVADLGKLADAARRLKPRKADDFEDMDALAKFSTVALEYSKLFDVVLNQSPEYAGLAWAVIRMLLIAHTNHSKLKASVERYIIQFGQGFGVVNHLMMSHPSEKMVDAVCEAYTAFSKFLAKAVKYYKESRLMTAIKALGFPWETGFQAIVLHIEETFKRIKDIASAGHLGIAVQTHEMITTIGCGQDRMRDEIYQNHIELRHKLKHEMREEMQSLFQTFDRDWITRFEQILAHSNQGHPTSNRLADDGTITAGPESGRTENANTAGRIAPVQVATSTSFLADQVAKPKRLKRFRDKAFPLLQDLDNDRAETNIRLRYTSNQDLQQIMALLRHEQMRVWLPASSSSVIWVNTVARSGPIDWTTVFCVRIVEHAAAVDSMVALYHLCGNHAATRPVSTAHVLIQSLIMQLVEQRHHDFVHRTPPFTLEYFQDVREDIEDLWDLFLQCRAEAKVSCLWIVLDHIDNLRLSEGYEFLLQALLSLVQDEGFTVKILCSARVTGTPTLISEAATSNPSVHTVTIPRAANFKPTRGPPQYKRSARLRDEQSPERPVVKMPDADIDALLRSSSDDSSTNEEGDTQPAQGRHTDQERDNTEIESDDSMEFMFEDPFASTGDEDEDDIPSPPRDMQDGHHDDSDESFTFTSHPHAFRSADLLSRSDSSERSGDEGAHRASLGSSGLITSRRQWQQQRTASLRGRRLQRSDPKSTTGGQPATDASSSD